MSGTPLDRQTHQEPSPGAHPAGDAQAELASGGAQPPQLPRRILIAEDEHLLAINLAHNLRSLAFEVIGPAANGDQAIALAKEHNPDLALLDIRMPGTDGLAAAQVLFCQMGIPVVVLSAFSDAEYLKVGTRIGVFGYLLKPVTLDELRVNIAVAWSRYLQHMRLRDEVQGLRTMLENRKIIERAKGLLMEKLGITEDQAMKRLQKQARDSRRKLADLAQAILQANDLLSNQE
ncbi:MAG: response regulator [Phycisphaeraceae bacterium]